MSAPFKNDNRPYQALHYCDKLLGGPGLTRELAEAFFYAADIHDADVAVDALRGWLQNERRFPCPADLAGSLGNLDTCLEDLISQAIRTWCVQRGGLMTATEIAQSTDRAVAAIVAGAPNANTATTPESAFWKTATGPSGS